MIALVIILWLELSAIFALLFGQMIPRALPEQRVMSLRIVGSGR